MSVRYETRPCRGRSQRTGKRVGSRHRWDVGNCCIWCGRFKEDVLVKIVEKPPKIDVVNMSPQHRKKFATTKINPKLYVKLKVKT